MLVFENLCVPCFLNIVMCVAEREREESYLEHTFTYFQTYVPNNQIVHPTPKIVLLIGNN